MNKIMHNMNYIYYICTIALVSLNRNIFLGGIAIFFLQ